MLDRLTSTLQKLFLSGLFLSLGLLTVELLSRFVIEPVNVLRPQLVEDPILGHAIRPESGGHDAWGYRNRIVPESADIVAIGDSQTYGVSAPARDAWPVVLGQLSQRSMYNLSLGGYGPVQYFHLLTSKAIKLRPRLVIVGLYLGNDLLETYELVQKNPHWAHLKRSEYFPRDPSAPAAAAALPEEPAFFADLRTWLAQHSIVYNVVIYSLVGEIARVAEAVFISRQTGRGANVRYDKNGIHTGFTPELRLKALDLKDARVNEGLRISLDLFASMKAYCAAQAIELLVVLIPTKESVYARYLEKDPPGETLAALKSLWAYERAITAIVKAFFEKHGIAHLNLLPALQEQLARLQLYPGNFDGHPNRNGYRVIAEHIDRYLRGGAPLTAIDATAGISGLLAQ